MTSQESSPIHLDRGAHSDPAAGMCLMEAVAYVQGEPHTDHPACVSPVLGVYGRALNDALPDELRQRLVLYIDRLPGTAGDGRDERRGYIALDWLIRTYLPAWLDLSPHLTEHSERVRALPTIVSRETAEQAGAVLAAAWAAARDAAEPEHAAAAGDAARAATGDAAWVTSAAARDAAEPEHAAAARDAARAATAAWGAAAAPFIPTVTALHESAIALLGDLIDAKEN